jgi:phage shock protein E
MLKKILTTLSIFLLLFAVSCTKKPKEKIYADIAPPKAFKLIKNPEQNKDLVILDVRTGAEYKAQRIPNSINIDFRGPYFIKELNKLDKSKTYLVYCRSGSRSKKTHIEMKQLGFERIYNLSGGINDWVQYKLPTNF